MVVPIVISPESALILPFNISKNWVIAILFFDINAILSPLFTMKLMFLNKWPYVVDFFKLEIEIIWFPASLSWWKVIPGYFLEDGFISSISRLSNIFLRLVACFDLAAFAENLEMNSMSSLFFSSAFLFLSDRCLKASWDDWYQKV